MQLAFGGMVRNRLQNPNCQTIFRAIEIEDILAGVATLFLFPMKQFFDLRMFDDGHALVIIEEPLDDIRQRVIVDVAVTVSPEYGRVRG